MQHTNKYAHCMPRVIQLRNALDDLNLIFRARASEAEMSLSEYLVAEIREIAECPTLSDLRQRVELRQPVDLPVPVAARVRAGRRDR